MNDIKSVSVTAKFNTNKIIELFKNNPAEYKKVMKRLDPKLQSMVIQDIVRSRSSYKGLNEFAQQLSTNIEWLNKSTKKYKSEPNTHIYQSEFIKDNPYSEELSQDEIRSINDYLAENPNSDVKSVYKSIIVERGNRSNQEKIDNNKSYWSRTVPRNFEQMWDNIKGAAQSGMHLIDLPGRAVAGSVDVVKAYVNNTKPEYNIKDYILESGRPMPILGTEFARSNPLASGLIDIISPGAIFSGLTAASKLARGVSVLSRRPITPTYRNFNNTSGINYVNAIETTGECVETFNQLNDPTFQYVKPVTQQSIVEVPKSNKIIAELPVNQTDKETGPRPGSTIYNFGNKILFEQNQNIIN